MKGVIALCFLFASCGDTIIEDPTIFAWGRTGSEGTLWSGKNVVLNPGGPENSSPGVYFYGFETPEPDLNYVVFCSVIGCTECLCPVTAVETFGFQVATWNINGTIDPSSHYVIAFHDR